jgi:ribulose-phosphate 3-epimerase
MSCLLAPSILSSNYCTMADSVKQMMDGGADWIHLDVMDGQFVPPITFGAQFVSDLRALGSTPFEVHLMTLTPERHFEAFIKAGCTRVIFHTEVTDHAHRHLQTLKAAGVQRGLAINPGTAACAIEPLIDEIDLALVMTVNPGWGGQSFISGALKKVKRLRDLREDLQIEVDGGIDPKTIGTAYKAGANIFVTGSFVAGSPSIAGAMQELRQACG